MTDKPWYFKLPDEEVKRRAMALLAEASDDDETEAGIRADLANIDQAIALLDDLEMADHPDVAEEIDNLRALRGQGVALMLRHRLGRLC
jgi:hypothetical protein